MTSLPQLERPAGPPPHVLAALRGAPGGSDDFGTALRRAIREPHDVIETTPIAVAMAAGTVGRAAYAALLVQTWHLHSALEALFDRSDVLLGMFLPEMRRLSALERDLRFLGCWPAPAPEPVAARELEGLLASAAAEPERAAGYLYVLEGSRMGSMVLRRTLARALGSDGSAGTGLDYHVADLEQTPFRLRVLKTALAETLHDATRRARVLAGARELMDALLAIYRELPSGAPAESAR